MIPAIRNCTRDEMMKRVAFFRDLKGSKTGLPDSDLPECERELINVIGFQPPDDEGAAVSPVGSAAARLSAIPVSEGFNLGFARCKPGRGPLMHNHDSNETFMPITGRWRRLALCRGDAIERAVIHAKQTKQELRLRPRCATMSVDQSADALSAAGVKRISGVVADRLNGLTNAIPRQGKIEWIHGRPGHLPPAPWRM